MSTQRERELTTIARKALSGEALSEAEFALLEKVEAEFEPKPSGGKFPYNPVNPWHVPGSNPPKPECSACGLDLSKPLNYVCPRQDCPCFPKITCDQPNLS